MTYTCEICKQTFDSEKGKNVHKGKTDHKPFHKKPYLVSEYIEKKRSAKDIAREWDVDSSIVYEYLERHGIDRRGRSDAFSLESLRNPVPFYQDDRGYEFWQDKTGGDIDKVYHHRLLAVAEYGVEAVKGMDVHHKNEVKWDNRTENIDILSKSDHTRLHASD